MTNLGAPPQVGHLLHCFRFSRFWFFSVDWTCFSSSRLGRISICIMSSSSYFAHKQVGFLGRKSEENVAKSFCKTMQCKHRPSLTNTYILFPCWNSLIHLCCHNIYAVMYRWSRPQSHYVFAIVSWQHKSSSERPAMFLDVTMIHRPECSWISWIDSPRQTSPSFPWATSALGSHLEVFHQLAVTWPQIRKPDTVHAELLGWQSGFPWET